MLSFCFLPAFIFFLLSRSVIFSEKKGISATAISAELKISHFDFLCDAIPAFLCIIAMPLAYSISEGISIGVISWTLINLLTGKASEKRISVLMYFLTFVFILKYILL